MEILKNEYQHVFQSSDGYGVFQIRITNNLSQLQMHTSMNDWDHEVFADTNIQEITMLRDMLTMAIDAELERRAK
ncbi:hypothetical protein [Sphingobacterium multivorum]|uniref:hypothetical protein n=1 Tax=Sphingobacterium multivorum TaxID=28454 RepID=UPI000E900C44|nr:hypothetical protein [Sphingobacterium multivorum]HBI88394.1 hypothetical protein [Sphingobacterium sp.]